MKRFLRSGAALLLILCLFAGMVPSAAAYGVCSDWAKTSLDAMEEMGILPAEFNNGDMRLRVTRQELCHMVVTTYRKLTGREAKAKKTNYFKDTTDPDICAAYELGLVSGTGNGYFSPDKDLTRQELFKMICNLYYALGWTDDEILERFKTFRDNAKVSTWAVDAAKTMLEVGVVYGDSNGDLLPLGNTTVEQAIAMFLRAYRYIRDWLSTFQAETGEEVEDPAPLETHMYGKISKWATENVNTAEAYGFIPERLNGEDFTRKITREEVCEIAVKVYTFVTGDEHYTGTSYFRDTTNPVISIAYEKQIVSGTGNGQFSPTRPITRQELFCIIYNMMASIGWERLDNTYELFSPFGDRNQVASWSYNATKILLQLDLLKGVGENGKTYIRPTQTCSRQEAAVMFYRAYRYISIWYSDHPLDPDSYPGHVHTATPVAEQAVDLAYAQLGKPYVYATQGPNSFDCSGLVYWIYHTKLGFSMGRTATAQWKNGVQISVDKSGFSSGKWGNLLPGDLVYFASSPGSASIGHIGIYVGDGYFIHASTPRTGVIKSRLSESYYVARFYGARRISY